MRPFKIIILSFLLWFVSVQGSFCYAAETGTTSQESGNVVSKRLIAVDQRLKTILENQKKIAADNQQVQEELKSLRVWIFRRGGGASG